MENKIKDFSVLKYIVRSFGQIIKATYFTFLASWIALLAGLLIAPQNALQALEAIKNLFTKLFGG